MADHNVVLLGFTMPHADAREAFALDSMPAVQTHKFAWSLARSLAEGLGSVFLASSCPIQNYPKGRRILFRGRRFREDGFEGLVLSFVNVLGLKHLTRMLACLVGLTPIIRRRRIHWIIVHGIHTPFLLYGLLARRFGVKLAVVLTDPAGVMLPGDCALVRLLKRADARIVRNLLWRADAFLCLAPGLVEHFALHEPVLRIPGIVSSRFEVGLAAGRAKVQQIDCRRRILYAGGLSAAYGVGRLIDAVLNIEGMPVQLRLYGRGDQEDRARELAAADARFFYGGFVGEEALIDEMLAADVLVNPRPSGEDFARLSFPSKLLEYIASGRPALTTNLVSIPETLRPHLNVIEDESAAGIEAALRRLLALPEDELQDRARAAREAALRDFSERAVGIRFAGLIRTANERNKLFF